MHIAHSWQYRQSQGSGSVIWQSQTGVLEKKIFVVEDHAAIRQGIVEALNREPDLAVCGEAEDEASALAAIAAAGGADLVLTDIQLGASNGIELIRELRRLYPALPLVAMTMFDPVRYERLARAAGANGFAVKQEGLGKLIKTIKVALETRH